MWIHSVSRALEQYNAMCQAETAMFVASTCSWQPHAT